MANLLLVHCGFAGGWTWSEVADRLRARGHRVCAPTLTGLGDRAHLARPDTDLTTHIRDLAATIDCEEISDLLLVASSSGSMAATGLLGARPHTVRRIVYVDTLVPQPGQSWMDLLGPAVATPLREAARRFGDGWRVPRTDVHPPRWVPQPLASVEQPLPRGDPAAGAVPCSFVHCTAKPEGWFFGLGPVIAAQAERARALGWDLHELPTDHLPMLSAPQALASLLHRIATAADEATDRNAGR